MGWMKMNNLEKTNRPFILLLFAALLLVVPAGAVNTAIYGDTAGFNAGNHTDFVVMYSLPGSSGADFDTNADRYTNSSVNVIFIGGNDAFSPVTAGKIEQAVFRGKVLVLTYTSNHKFDGSLPASNAGSAPTGQSLVVTKPDTPLSQEIFAGLSSNYTNSTPPFSRESAIPRKGAVTLLSYDNNDPALIYWQYGNGYVIEWTLNNTGSFMTGGEADTINYRLINYLLKSVVPVTASTTPVPTPQPTTTPVNQTPAPGPSVSYTTQPLTGNLSVFSSPDGANILIDGIYYGKTPATISGIPSGNHIVRLTLSGYHDYESNNVGVFPDRINQVFGTLIPLSVAQQTPVPTTAATPIIVAIPVTPQPTQTGGMLENPGVVAGIIGVVTASIGAAATIYTHMSKIKKP